MMSGFVRQHGWPVALIGVASLLGVLATAGFQLVVINGLDPEQFGLLAAFLAILNVVAVGSAATRNSVAVTTALRSSSPGRGVVRDVAFLETSVLGASIALALVVASRPLADALGSGVIAVWFTAAATLPFFYFARAQGLLQGVGKTTAVVWWTTGAQVAQLLLAAVVIYWGTGVGGVLVVVLVVAVVSAIGSSIHARGIVSGGYRPFAADTVTVLLLTVGFAWLTNADVVLVRSLGSDDAAAGAFAAAGVIVKTILIVPATLSLYLLPRFVGRRDDNAITRLGVNVTLGATATFGVLMIIACWALGPWIVSVLYPDSYTQAASFLPALAAMWLPWASAQAVLIRVTASAMRTGLYVIGLAAAVQLIGGWLLLPDVTGFMIVNGVAGVFALSGFLLIHYRESR